MSLRDYIIDHATFDWQQLLAPWHWRLPGRLAPWMMNRFGDLFLKTDDGRIHLLRLDDGTLSCLANSRDHFGDLLDYVVEDVAVRSVEFQYAALGPIFEQLEGVPDGTHVTFRLRGKQKG